MPETNSQVRPYVYETLVSKAMHFSISEIQSRMDVRRPYALDLDYTRTMAGFLLFNGAPKTIGMIGLGGGSLAKFCHRFVPGASIKVVDINPHVIALRDEFQVPADDERFRVRLRDGADLVRSPPHPFDVLMVDGFDSEGQPEALCSQAFYDDCAQALSPEGVLAVNLHAWHAEHEQHLARIRRSFAEEVLVVRDADGSNAVVFAFRSQRSCWLQSPSLKRPGSFDQETWGELLPAFQGVARAVAASGRVAGRVGGRVGGLQRRAPRR